DKTGKEIINKDDDTTFQNTTMETEYVETTDTNIEVDLKPEVAVKESQNDVKTKDREVQSTK
ncbi:MAG: hypothetical protein KTM48_01860, partial [Wolbachia endosymbiont of Pissodes strobi]|nr:hypothetical protein [Wolbachia endosymbiont of Pissodes strobi]